MSGAQNSTSKPSQYRGVYKCAKKWKSQSEYFFSSDAATSETRLVVQISGKQEYLGIFYTEDQVDIALPS
jgi:hypothetical protein